jgi:ferrous iron transport protein B
VLTSGVVDRTARILLSAVLVEAPEGLVLFILANIRTPGGPLLTAVCGFLDPFARLFGLDGPILAAFILGFPANELVLPILLMAYTSSGTLAEAGGAELFSVLSANGWTVFTALSTVLFSLFHWPCSTTLLTVRKEAGGTKWMLLAAALPTAFGMILLAALKLFSSLLF